MQHILSDGRRYHRGKSKQERRANRTEDQLPSYEGMGRLHNVNPGYLHGKDGPLKRWLRVRLGNHWNDVFSEAAQVFRQDDFIGKHLRSKLLEMVERNTFMRDGEVWCLNQEKWEVVRELPVLKLPKRGRRFYVHPETGVLCKIPDRPRPPFVLQQKEQRFGGVRRWLPQDRLLLKLEGHWFDCRMVRYPHHWQEAPYDAVFKTLLIESHARSAYGEPVYCVRKRQLSRKELRQRGLSNSKSAADGFLTVLGPDLIGRIRRSNGNPARCWLQCRIRFWIEASAGQFPSYIKFSIGGMTPSDKPV